MKRTAWAGLLALHMVFPCSAGGQTDSLSTRVQAIEEVEVQARRLSREVAATAPAQTMKREMLSAVATQNVADAMRHFAGTNVRDYGGIGGLKTVSVRGLGATHTAVSYDGVVVGNCQAGQIDLGRFATRNMGAISLHIGQDNDLISSARAIASGSIINLSSHTPEWNERAYHFETSVTGGSFGYVNPTVNYTHRLKEHSHTGISLDLSRAHGRYPYEFANGKQTIKDKRANTDVRQGLAEWYLHHQFADNSHLDTKFYAYASERGLPSAVILYNNNSTERLSDRNLFAQMRYTKWWGEQWQLRTSAKYTYGWDRYTDTNVKYENGKQIDENLQREYYAQATLRYRPAFAWEVSLAQDAFINTLTSNLPSCPLPTRLTSLTALQARYRSQRLSIHGIVLGTATHEQVIHGSSPIDYRRLSPTLSASVRPFEEEHLFLRLMYKQTFRLPTFNDLYYHRSGNRTLRPEQAHEYNAGITWQAQPQGALRDLTLTIDGYFNDVTDKIVAFPSTYVWKMANYGHVHITGLDATANATLQPMPRLGLNVGANYTLNRAIDITNPTAQSYRTQLPYTPIHSGSARLLLTTPWGNMGYSILLSGGCYSMSEQTARYRINGHAEHTLTLSHTFSINGMPFTAQAEAINLTDAQYQIIQYYPMPGRQFRATLTVNL